MTVSSRDIAFEIYTHIHTHVPTQTNTVRTGICVMIMLIVCVKIEPTLFQLRLEKTDAEHELKKLLGQLLYLDNLNKVCV